MAAILVAGMAAGTINTLVGSGTLITFPTLLAFGIPPVTANVSNNVGLVPGALSGTLASRAELTGQRPATGASDRPRSSAARSGRSCCSCSRRRCSPPSSPS